jgi:hypothetical protein
LTAARRAAFRQDIIPVVAAHCDYLTQPGNLKVAEGK